MRRFFGPTVTSPHSQAPVHPRRAETSDVAARTPASGALLPLLGLLLLVLIAACARPVGGLIAAPTTFTPSGGTATTGGTLSSGHPSHGARIITRADRGTTVHISVGEGLILRLPGGTAWDIQITDPRVVTADRLAPLPSGSQGIYRARRVGITELLAVTLPPCARDRPACKVVAPVFRVVIVVRLPPSKPVDSRGTSPTSGATGRCRCPPRRCPDGWLPRRLHRGATRAPRLVIPSRPRQRRPTSGATGRCRCPPRRHRADLPPTRRPSAATPGSRLVIPSRPRQRRPTSGATTRCRCPPRRCRADLRPRRRPRGAR